MHSRLSKCICHFFDVDNVIIELEQIRGHNQEVSKITPWSECLTVYTPHAVENAICVKPKTTKVQLLSTMTAKREKIAVFTTQCAQIVHVRIQLLFELKRISIVQMAN